jgi:hypothetical protein
MRISLFKQGAQAHETRLVEEEVEIRDFEDVAKFIINRPWSPAVFKDRIRSNKNLDYIGLLVLDVDEGCTLDEAKEHFSHYAHIIATTKSHQQEKNGVVCDRFRVILALPDSVHTDKRFKQYWHRAFAAWPFIDPACKDAARFFYPSKDIISVQHGEEFGHHIDLEEEPDFDGPDVEVKQVVGKRGKLSRATLEFIANGAPDGEWHGKLFKAVMDFKEQGYSIDEATERLQKVTGTLDLHDEQTIEDVYANREPKYSPRILRDLPDWPIMVPNKDGIPKPDLAHPDNYRHWMRSQGYSFTSNVFDGLIYLNDKTIEEGQVSQIFLASKEWGFKCGKDFIWDLIQEQAYSNRFNPFKRLIEAAPWDGQDHIGNLFNTLTLQEGADVEQSKAWFTKWFIGIAAKCYSPGAQNFVLTFLGAQGIGKSRWLSRLDGGVGGFGEGAIDPNNKDHELRHLTHIIWHIPELEYTTGKREAGALKDYLTKETISVRPAYARATRVGKSTCSFCASVNNPTFLIDQTGNRRFVTLPLKAIDPNHDVSIQQVYAQAFQLYKDGVPWWLDAADTAALAEVNEEYQQETEIQYLLRNIESGDTPYPAVEVLQIVGIANPTAAQLRELGVVMAKKGIVSKRIGKAQIRHYFCENLRAVNLPTIKSKANN